MRKMDFLNPTLSICALRFAYCQWFLCSMPFYLSSSGLQHFYVLNYCIFILVFGLQSLALSACTTLVSVEPKLTTETRNLVMKVIVLTFFISEAVLICLCPLNSFASLGRPLLDFLVCLMSLLMLLTPLLATWLLFYVQYLLQGISLSG